MEVGHWGRGPSTLCAVLCSSVHARDHHLQSAAVVPLLALLWGDSFGNTLSLACPLFLLAARGVLTLNMCQCWDQHLSLPGQL